MFWTSRKTAELKQRISDCHAALQRIAQHVGVAEYQLPPDRLATAICGGIDVLVGKKPPIASAPGSESRSIPANIRKIKLSGAVDIVVSQGHDPEMNVFTNGTADLSMILTTISGDCLTVDNEPMMIVNDNGRAVAQVFHGISMQSCQTAGKRNGSGDIVDQRISPPRFRVEVTLPNVDSLRISGAGNVTYLGIDQDELSLDVSGAGTIEASGKVNRLEADVSGAGDIAASLLSAAHARLRVSGAGNIEAAATESVVARVSGVGKIKVGGNPQQRDTDVSGMGKIKFIATPG